MNQYFEVSGDRLEEVPFALLQFWNVHFWVNEKMDDMCMCSTWFCKVVLHFVYHCYPVKNSHRIILYILRNLGDPM